jgi:hypothetical protein
MARFRARAVADNTALPGLSIVSRLSRIPKRPRGSAASGYDQFFHFAFPWGWDRMGIELWDPLIKGEDPPFFVILQSSSGSVQ